MSTIGQQATTIHPSSAQSPRTSAGFARLHEPEGWQQLDDVQSHGRIHGWEASQTYRRYVTAGTEDVIRRLEHHVVHRPATHAQLRGVDHENPLARFNARFGLFVTQAVGTMWTGYVFTLLAFLSLPTSCPCFAPLRTPSLAG